MSTSVLSQQILKQQFSLARALGDKEIVSDATFEIKGFENMYLLTKQFPEPNVGPQGEIEVMLPNGDKAWQPQAATGAFQGPIAFYETVEGTIDRFLKEVVKAGGRFDGALYKGTPDRHKGGRRYVDCFFVPDVSDRDWENRSQVKTISGNLFFHYYGDDIKANA